MSQRKRPARLLVISSTEWADPSTVHAALDLAARRLRGHDHDRWIDIITPPAPVDASAEPAIYAWITRHDHVSAIDPPDEWEDTDHPDPALAADLVGRAAPDLVVVFDRFGSPTLTEYTAAAALTLGIPTWTFQHHRRKDTA